MTEKHASILYRFIFVASDNCVFVLRKGTSDAKNAQLIYKEQNRIATLKHKCFIVTRRERRITAKYQIWNVSPNKFPGLTSLYRAIFFIYCVRSK